MRTAKDNMAQSIEKETKNTRREFTKTSLMIKRLTFFLKLGISPNKKKLLRQQLSLSVPKPAINHFSNCSGERFFVLWAFLLIFFS